MTGFSWGGDQGATWGGEEGSQWGIDDPIPPENLSVVTTGEDEIQLEWDLSGLVTQTNVYRAEESGNGLGDYEFVTSVDYPTRTFVDGDLVNGRTYYYRITTENAISESPPSGEDSDTTDLAGPEIGGFDTSEQRVIGVSIDLQDNNPDGNVIIHRDGAEVATVDVSAGEHADSSGILDGEEYEYHLERDTGQASATGAPASTISYMPDATGLGLDATEAESLGATWDNVLNNGEYRLELRDDDPEGDHPPYEHEATIDFDQPLEYTIANILGGEQYSVRIRTQTAYKTGNWLAAEELTKLLASGPLGFGDVGLVELALLWTINNDFRGSHQIRRRNVTYGEGGDFADNAELLGTVADDTDSFVDDTVIPAREYRYRVRTVTQWQHADSEVSSTVETEDLAIGRSPVPPRGWHAEVDHPSGNVLTPQITDGAQLEPRLNAQPQAQLPVPKDDTWYSEDLEDAAMRVWKDGKRRPVDELEDVGGQAGRNELVGVGGTQLEKRIQTDVVDEQVDELVMRLIEEHTDYVANVDAPDGGTMEALVQAAATGGEWGQHTEETDLSTFPVGIDDDTDELYLQRSNLHFGTSNDDLQSTSGASPDNSDDYADGQAMEIASFGASYDNRPIELEYTIPADAVRVAGRLYGDIGSYEITLTLHDATDDSVVASMILYDGDGFLTDDPQWFYSDDDFGGVAEWTDGDLGPGEYYVSAEATASGDPISIDVVSIHDSRFEYTFDDDTTVPASGDPYLDGPEPYPDSIMIRLDPYPAILSVRGGEAVIEIDDTSGDQEIAISNDGSEWIRAANATSVSGEFEQLSGRLITELTLSRYGDVGEGETPRYGINGQRVANYELTGTLDETPVITHRSYDDDLANVLTKIAEDTDSLWEVRQDGDQTTFEWSQPGQRESDDEPAVQPDYQVTKHNRRILKATVIGGRTAVADEPVEAVLEGRAALNERNLIPGSERVTDGDTTTYRPGIDYDLYAGAGELDIRDGGDIEDDQALVVDYDYNVSNSYEHPDFDGDAREETTEQIPQAATSRACGQAAKVLVDELSEPRVEADVTIPPGEDIGGLIEALDIEEIPGNALAVYETDVTPDGQRARLGNRKRVADTVQRIQSRLAATSERV